MIKKVADLTLDEVRDICISKERYVRDPFTDTEIKNCYESCPLKIGETCLVELRKDLHSIQDKIHNLEDKEINL